MGWESDVIQYEGNLSVVARLDLKNLPELLVNSQMVLGAFMDDECHGYVTPLISNEIGYEPFFLNVSNNGSGQSIQFRLFDGSSGKSYSINEIRPFVPNAVYGTIKDPVVLTLKGLMTGSGGYENDGFIRCYPNPFNKEVAIEFSGIVSKTTIDVINTTGSLVKQIYNGYPVNGMNTVYWNGTNGSGNDVAPGIYYIRFISDNNTETVKISKIR